MIHHMDKTMQNAAMVTYGSSGASIVLWGLSISEWGVIVSTLCAVGGLAVQLYLARRATRDK